MSATKWFFAIVAGALLVGLLATQSVLQLNRNSANSTERRTWDLTNNHSNFKLRTLDGCLLTDCLQIDVLELPKYDLPSDNISIASPLEMWLYFFRRAMNCRSELLLERLPDPVFEEAVGILEMIQRDPNERRLYQARLKAERDAASNFQDAYQAGELKGQIESERRFIRMLQELLMVPMSSDAELEKLSLEELKELTASLQSRLRQR